MKTILLTGGGTAGHVTPHLALLPALKDKYTVVYMGSHTGIEKEIIKNKSIPYYGISTGKLRRYISIENIKDAFLVIKGIKDAFFQMRKIRPHIIFSKGGYVSVPVVIAGFLLGIPIVIHESDITPGLATKIAAPFSKKICVTFPETMAYLPKNKITVTGTPLREELFFGSKEKGLALCHFTSDLPVLLVMGGSSGAQIINTHLEHILPILLTDFQVVHICGKGNKPSFSHTGYAAFEYVYDALPHIFAMSDIAVSRAGANAIWELVGLSLPHLLIPLSKKVSRGDQILNAASFEKQGFSKVLLEEDMSDGALLKNIHDVYKNRDFYKKAMAPFAKNTGNAAVLEIIESTIK